MTRSAHEFPWRAPCEWLAPKTIILLAAGLGALAAHPFLSTKGASGTGLGLALVYGIVTRHQGTIAISSAPGNGTAVTLTFPVPEQANGVTTTAMPDPASFRKLNILLVDDDQVIHHATSAFLVREGHVVESAFSGVAGLERFNQRTFDLIITDWAMPEMSGDQLAVAIKNISPAMPIIMLTGFADTGAVPSQRSSGVDLVLGKPFTLNELRNAISQVTSNSA